MVLPSWMGVEHPGGLSARTITPTIGTIVATRNPIIGVAGQGLTDQAELTHPRLLGLMSDLRAGCGVRREAASEGRHSLKAATPGVPAGLHEFPPLEGAVT
jgi:hypothetical protein